MFYSRRLVTPLVVTAIRNTNTQQTIETLTQLNNTTSNAPFTAHINTPIRHISIESPTLTPEQGDLLHTNQ